MTVPEETWRRLLAPYIEAEPPADLLEPLDHYLALLLRWNQRMNLTAVREPERMIERHFGESLFAARLVPRGTTTLLDHGSGAGFPGLPIALARPEISVMLTESSAKKAAFLREVARELALPLQVSASRTEDLPPDNVFDCVTMRAVDRAAASLPVGAERVGPAGTLLVLGKEPTLPGWHADRRATMPNSAGSVWLYTRDVPRGTNSA